MTKIRVLDEDVARQIAAGEVVERPASVVKELFENALDAGAKSISIRTQGAGVKLVEVHDDGCGLTAQDVVLAAKSFATSKIANSADLFQIETYGFRGEALASISSVSRFDLVSSDQTGGEGWRIRIEGKSITDSKPAPHEKGTTVTARDLFFNTPARKKFLKSETTERKRILETVLSFALIYPELEIHYAEDGRPGLDLVPAGTWRDRVASILGSATMKHMVEVKSEQTPFRLGGFISLPTHTRANRNHQFLFVNRRLVKERTMLRAVQEAYRTVIPSKRFPVMIVSLEIPFGNVDVNVHPTKLEVRLDNPRRVFEVVHGAIKQALSSRSESTLTVSYSTAPTPPRAVERANWSSVSLAGVERTGRQLHPSDEDSKTTYQTRIKDAYSSYMEGHASSRVEFNPQLSLQVEQTKTAEGQPVTPLGDKVEGEAGLFWQFNNSFIFIQVRGGIVVIDQHAAHERIIFDTCKNQLESEIPVSQQMLFPIHLELSLRELEVFRSSRDTFSKLGFHLEPFGGKSVLVRGCPQGLRNWDEGNLLRQMFDDILQDRFPGKSHADRIIASFACRSAVKAGQKLSVQEMKMLADQLFAVPNPYSCPHGRPTIQRISLEEIEGWFLRR
jgi:DNA mismatch repair protein MutL